MHIDVLLSSFIVIVFFTIISSFPFHFSYSSPPHPRVFLNLFFPYSLFVSYFSFMFPFYLFASFSIFAPFFILSVHFRIFPVSFSRSSLVPRILLKFRDYLSSTCFHVDFCAAKVEIAHS